MAVGDTHNGALVKQVDFHGVSAHAGGAPWLGVNALKAANLACVGIDAQRDTFREDETVRVQAIITRGGDTPTAIPAHARLELVIRARTAGGLADASHKVDRALKAGADALGAGVDILTLPAYLPSQQDPNLSGLIEENCRQLVGETNIGSARHRTGSTDMGDLSHIMPIIQPRFGGSAGSLHGADYLVVDPELSILVPAKAMAMTAVDLLVDGATEAVRVKAEASDSKITRDEYLQLRRRLGSEESMTTKESRQQP